MLDGFGDAAAASTSPPPWSHAGPSKTEPNDDEDDEVSVARAESTIDSKIRALMMGVAQPSSSNSPRHRRLQRDESEMSIDEHLSSIPSPHAWPDHFRYSQQDLAMLGGMAVTKDPYKAAGLVPPNSAMNSLNCGAQQGIASSEYGVAANGSSSGPSSSSCSPTTSEHAQHAIRHTTSTESALDVVNSMISSSSQMKAEPLDATYDSLPSLIGMPMHLSQLLSADPFSSLSPNKPFQTLAHDPYSSARSSLDGLRQPPTTTAGSAPAAVHSRRSRSSNDGMFKCQFCPKKFTDDSLLQQHMADCRLLRIHECQQCGKRFKARGGLQQHMRSRIHSSDRPYACQFCAKRFTQKSHVDQHERIHTGLKPFVCQFCGRAFRQRSQQLGHEATHQHAGSRRRAALEDAESRRDAQQQQQQPQQQSQPTPSSAGHLSTTQPSQSDWKSSSLSQTQLDSALDSMLHQTLPSIVAPQNPLQQSMAGQQLFAASPQSAAAPLNNLFAFPANCTNNAMSSLLALSQNMSCPPQTSAYGSNMALGLINSIQ